MLTFGLAAHSLSSAIFGSIIGLAAVVLAGILLRKPLTKIPENTMKFIVGLMLSGFGVFWVGEGLNVRWWHQDVSILTIIACLLVVSALSVLVISRYKKMKKMGAASKIAG